MKKVTYEKGWLTNISVRSTIKMLVEANIRKAFCDKTDFNTTEELIPEEANFVEHCEFYF